MANLGGGMLNSRRFDLIMNKICIPDKSHLKDLTKRRRVLKQF